MDVFISREIQYLYLNNNLIDTISLNNPTSNAQHTMFEIPFVVPWLSSLDPEEAATVQPMQTRHGCERL